MNETEDFPGLISIDQVGSTVTVDPPVEGTDVDYLVLVKEINTLVVSHLRSRGYTWTHNFDYDVPFFSVRQGDTNLILTDSEEYHKRFMLATSIAKALNLKKKIERVILFQGILYGKGPEALYDPRGTHALQEEFATNGMSADWHGYKPIP